MPDVPDWVVFPETEWQTLTPAAAGFRQPDFDNDINGHAPRPLNFWGDVRRPDEFAAVLTRGGYLVKSWGRTKGYVYQSSSVGKAFTRAVLGLAVDKLGLNPDEPVWRTWSGAGALSHPHKYLDNEAHSSITWRHLVDHTAGFAIESAYSWRKTQPGAGTWYGQKWTGNPVWDMYSFRPPGQQHYSSGNSVRLGQALTALWGLDLKTLLDNEIFSKLNVPAERWSWMSLQEAYQSYKIYPEHPGYGHYVDPPYKINDVVVRGGPGWVRMSAEDLARFGLLIATGGIWKGERLLSSEWLLSKSGGNGSSVFGDTATYVAGSRITADALPPYIWVDDFQTYSFPQSLIDPAIIPGAGGRSGAPPAPHVFGVDQTTRAGLYNWNGNSWAKSTVDAGARFTRLSAMFEPVSGSSQVFGIRADKALCQAYWDGRAWEVVVIDRHADLDALSAIYNSKSGRTEVFGVRASTRGLYQASWEGNRWTSRDILPDANLAGVSALYDPASRIPQVFGVRLGTGHLYQAHLDPDGWRSKVHDTLGVTFSNANPFTVSAVFDAVRAPLVFGIEAGTGALHKAYWNGAAWQSELLDSSARLERLYAVSGGSPDTAQVFGIQTGSRKLYRYLSETSRGVIDENANLTDVSAVFDTASNIQVFGTRAGTGEISRWHWNGTEWSRNTLAGSANFGDVDATFGALVSDT